MSSPRTMKVAVLALMATVGGSFVTPGPRATVSGADKSCVARSSTSRGDTSAVSPLNIAGFSLSSITDIFTRKKRRSLPAVALVSLIMSFGTK